MLIFSLRYHLAIYWLQSTPNLPIHSTTTTDTLLLQLPIFNALATIASCVELPLHRYHRVATVTAIASHRIPPSTILHCAVFYVD
jgi:hypothetical protein